MGANGSKRPQPHVIGQTEADMQFLRKNLNYERQEINALYKAFRKVDVRRNHLIEFDEFCARIKCEPTRFLRQLFSFFSTVKTDVRSKSSVALNFAEFVLFSTFFLTLHERGIAKYLHLVLTDSNFSSNQKAEADNLSLGDIIREIKDLFGDSLMGGERHIKRAMKVLDDDENGFVSEAEFINGCVGNKSMLFAPIAIQMDMRRKIIGKTFWRARSGLGDDLLLKNKITQLRDELCGIHVSERLASSSSGSNSSSRRESGFGSSRVIHSEFSNVEDVTVEFSERRGSR